MFSAAEKSFHSTGSFWGRKLLGDKWILSDNEIFRNDIFEMIIFWIDKLVYWFFCYLIVIILYFIFNKRVSQHGDIKNHYVSILTVGSAEKLKN